MSLLQGLKPRSATTSTGMGTSTGTGTPTDRLNTTSSFPSTLSDSPSSPRTFGNFPRYALRYTDQQDLKNLRDVSCVITLKGLKVDGAHTIDFGELTQIWIEKEYNIIRMRTARAGQEMFQLNHFLVFHSPQDLTNFEKYLKDNFNRIPERYLPRPRPPLFVTFRFTDAEKHTQTHTHMHTHTQTRKKKKKKWPRHEKDILEALRQNNASPIKTQTKTTPRRTKLETSSLIGFPFLKPSLKVNDDSHFDRTKRQKLSENSSDKKNRTITDIFREVEKGEEEERSRRNSKITKEDVKKEEFYKPGKRVTRSLTNASNMVDYDQYIHIGEMFVYPKSGVGSVSVTGSDAARLRPSEFLNDTIIDFYLRYLMEEKLSKQQSSKVYIFNTFFYKLLSKHTLDDESEFSGNVVKLLKKADILNKDFVLVPINYNLHWYLIAICYPKNIRKEYESTPEERKNDSQRTTILMFDSLHNYHRPQTMKAILKMLNFVNEIDIEVPLPKGLGVSVKVPHQTNSSDCGVFLLHFAELFIENPEEQFKRHKELYNWFDVSEVEKKRRNIFRLIQRKHQEASQSKS